MPSHAELMDSVYRRQRYIYDFTRKYYLFGRDRLIRELEPSPSAHIVEVGCGTARNLIRMARRYPGRRFFGLDASEAMLETAAKAIARAGLSDQIALAHGYAEALTPALFGAQAPFDEIVFSYSLSMIPDWKQSLSAASAALSPPGRIHIVDFGDLAGLAAPARKALLGWLALFHVEPRVELLNGLENIAQASTHLRLLPGRYAFLLSAPGDAFATLGTPVAPQSQGAEKTRIASA
ncbi:MAG TPA: class I SAM-dependent methyltransferase [Rhizomicrobium sp.]|nr:class I SAM-dependent methyltransferase [Rhizomicrobium sp.]